MIKKPIHNLYSSTNNPELRDNPNFSWSYNSQAFQQVYRPPNQNFSWDNAFQKLEKSTKISIN